VNNTTESPKIIMMVAASKALDYKSKKPLAESNEIIQYVMMNVSAMSNMKISAIAAANRDLKYKEQNPGANNKEIMQRIMDESAEIIESVDQ